MLEVEVKIITHKISSCLVYYKSITRIVLFIRFGMFLFLRTSKAALKMKLAFQLQLYDNKKYFI